MCPSHPLCARTQYVFFQSKMSFFSSFLGWLFYLSFKTYLRYHLAWVTTLIFPWLSGCTSNIDHFTLYCNSLFSVSLLAIRLWTPGQQGFWLNSVSPLPSKIGHPSGLTADWMRLHRTQELGLWMDLRTNGALQQLMYLPQVTINSDSRDIPAVATT